MGSIQCTALSASISRFDTGCQSAMQGKEVEILADVCAALEGGKEIEKPVLRAVHKIRQSATKSVQSSKWHKKDGLLYF